HASAKGDKARARLYYDEGVEHYRRGDFSEALSSLTRSITEDQGFLPSYSMRAQTRHALGDDTGASDLKRSLGISSLKHPEDAVARGTARLLAGDRKRALEDFGRAIKLDPESPDAYTARGRAHRAGGDLVSAVKDWTRALKIHPQHLVARYNRARAYRDLGHSDKAMEELTQTLRENPRFHLPYGLLGVIFAEKGDTDRAMKAYSKSLQLHPDYAFAYIGRAAVRFKLDQPKLAFQDLDEAVRSAPEDYAPYLNRGEARLRSGDREGAVSDFKSLLDPKVALDHPASAVAVGDRFRENGLAEEAIRMYTRALQAASFDSTPLSKTAAQNALLKRASALAS
ncbi:MAG: tetratricopeptide repeat protein, partial [Elusimicrobiota bacterium]